jgi:hypothetical protein
MGSASKRLGAAVTFAMTALNLRLGLWARHPASKESRVRLLPGLLVFKEFFGVTEASLEGGLQTQDVHLSDGGHFENLGLYELVRRHCRYIVVSDCGADKKVLFDDFGNAARRIREDFGIDIEIDLNPLEPKEAVSAQHVAVGTIHYDMRYDKGIIVYIKPALTGDEPADVTQYRTQNTSFPHETTADQFYEEAQWESYRRLGVHTALTAFGFVDRMRIRSVNRIFTGIRQEWYPTPTGLDAKVLLMTGRFCELDKEVQQAGSLQLELYPELGTKQTQPTPKLQAENLRLLIHAVQLMEDCFNACQLDEHWTHPLNSGWMTCFARWASATTFHAWWPFICPMFGPAFQRFMEERFPTLAADDVHLQLTAHGNSLPNGLATASWQQVMPGALRPECSVYSLELRRESMPPGVIEVGVAAVVLDRANHTAAWTSDDLFVPPSLVGSNLEERLLELLINELRTKEAVTKFNVTVISQSHKLGPAASAERTEVMDFYREQDFYMVEQGSAPIAFLPAMEPAQRITWWVNLTRVD